MTKYLLAGAAALALLTSAAAANAQSYGYVGANYARTNVDVGGLGDADVNLGELEGAVAFNGGAWGGQLDGALTYADSDGGDTTTISGTGHFNAKLGDNLLGGFAGVSHAEDSTLWALGGEGQAKLGAATTLYGQLGYGQIDDLSDVDFWAGRVELRHFVTDNFKLQGSLGAAKADSDFGDLDSWNAGVEAEYQFAGTQWSVVGGYDHAAFDDLDADSDTFRIGVRYTFSGSLRDRDAAGADLSSVRKLFGRAVGF
jgi:hypothetical protein